ncbi:dehydrodolichyl diphosphate synthase 6-like [Euphorbia lathyris]|uniref:Alkyl transferase n=1 Tax=Euphorbia lathyris TaxID=212925 RepID=A0A0A6ZAJ9_EUPLT|nr:dehydrodolichyl diphosphate synthase 6 [Euphorbia lathyris]
MFQAQSDRTSKVQYGSLYTFLRACVFRILSKGPIPNHLAFIMDGNRRYAKKMNLSPGEGYRAGSSALMNMLKYCWELGIKYITIYAFSIDNLKRSPEEVKLIMDLMMEKLEGFSKEDILVNEYGIRVYVIGNLKLLSEGVRVAAEKAMKATAKNSRFVLLICVAYTSCDEIRYAVEECCREKVECEEFKCGIKPLDVEKHMHMKVGPDPDVVIRTSGETRLSNFLLWQTSYSVLYSPVALWPEIGMWELVSTVLQFQRHHSYLEKKKKLL